MVEWLRTDLALEDYGAPHSCCSCKRKRCSN